MRDAVGRLLLVLAIFATPSCVAPPYADVVDCSDFVETPTEYHLEYAGRAGMLTEQEHRFVCLATVLARAQVTSATIAQERSASPAITSFAATTITDQESLDHRLENVAEQHAGLIGPHGLDAAHLDMLYRLSLLSGAAFDRAYLESQLQDAQETVAVLEEEIVLGSEPTLRSFARSALPILEERVREVQTMIEQLAS